MRTLRAALLLLCLAAPLRAAAQEASDHEALAAAAVAAIHERMPSGKGALDPDGYCTAHLTGWRCPETIDHAVDSLGMTLSSRLFTRVCLGHSGRCRLIGVDWLVRFDLPEMHGARRATVDATVWRHSSGGGAVVQERYRVGLRRSDGRWRAEEVEALGSG